MILRFLAGPGIPADDYIIIRGQDWLDRYGRDDSQPVEVGDNPVDIASTQLDPLVG